MKNSNPQFLFVIFKYSYLMYYCVILFKFESHIPNQINVHAITRMISATNYSPLIVYYTF